MQADARGAIKLGRKFGDTLICVRYRLSPDGSQRVTTVELQVDRVAVQKKANPAVSVKIYASETHLVAKAKAKGAVIIRTLSDFLGGELCHHHRDFKHNCP